MLRMRTDNATIRPIIVSKEKLQYLKEILESKRVAPFRRDKVMKEITGRCCICASVAEFEVIYDVQNATRKERYCSKCINSVYVISSEMKAQYRQEAIDAGILPPNTSILTTAGY